jgi:hypothetical protein
MRSDFVLAIVLGVAGITFGPPMMSFPVIFPNVPKWLHKTFFFGGCGITLALVGAAIGIVIVEKSDPPTPQPIVVQRAQQGAPAPQPAYQPAPAPAPAPAPSLAGTTLGSNPHHHKKRTTPKPSVQLTAPAPGNTGCAPGANCSHNQSGGSSYGAINIGG